MLAELEISLVATLRASPLAARLRAIDALPDLGGDRLISRFGADAPAVYVALGSGDFPGRGVARPQLGIACVCRNARSPLAARQGDGVSIGLLPLLEAVMIAVDGAVIDGREYEVRGWQMVNSDDLYRQGLYVGVVQVAASGLLPLDSAGEAP